MSRTVTMKGNPLDLEGPELKVGDAAPVALLRKDLANDFDLSEASGKLRVYSVVPSLDTGICAAQTKRFNEEAAKLGDIQFYTISMDLPVAMSRFCGAEGIDAKNMMMLSDHKLAEFGVPEDRFAEVAGKADTEPLFPEDTFLAANRRISILLLHEAPPLPINHEP